MPRQSLDHRLHQRGRRSGLMIGVSMAIAIVVLVAGFSVVFTALDPLVSDFVSDAEPDEIAAVNPPSDGGTTAQPTATLPPEPTAPPASDESAILPGPTAPPATDTAQPSATADADGPFQPDYQVTQRINLRSGPGTTFDVVVVLEAGTALQQIGDDGSPSSTAADDRWLEFRTEDGDEGFVREIDVEQS